MRPNRPTLSPCSRAGRLQDAGCCQHRMSSPVRSRSQFSPDSRVIRVSSHPRSGSCYPHARTRRPCSRALAGQEGLEPPTAGFGDRCAANCATALRWTSDDTAARPGPHPRRTCVSPLQGPACTDHGGRQPPAAECTCSEVAVERRDVQLQHVTGDGSTHHVLPPLHALRSCTTSGTRLPGLPT